MIYEFLLDLIRKVRIARLKKKAIKAMAEYAKYKEGIDAGHNLSQYISPGLSQAARRFDKIMAKLRKLDPKMPPHIPLSGDD